MANQDPVSVAGEAIATIERLERERDEITAEIKAVTDGAVGKGVDRKALTDALKRRKQDATQRAEHDGLVGRYMDAAK